jgi:hypothetical protein
MTTMDHAIGEDGALLTYAEALAVLAAGGWGKVGEAHNFAPDGRHVFEMEVWFRDGAGGPEWASLDASPGDGRGAADRRWCLFAGEYDPRALLSDELWGKLGPKPNG